jgi:hypothetical protein
LALLGRRHPTRITRYALPDVRETCTEGDIGVIVLDRALIATGIKAGYAIEDTTKGIIESHELSGVTEIVILHALVEAQPKK